MNKYGLTQVFRLSKRNLSLSSIAHCPAWRLHRSGAACSTRSEHILHDSKVFHASAELMVLESTKKVGLKRKAAKDAERIISTPQQFQKAFEEYSCLNGALEDQQGGSIMECLPHNNRHLSSMPAVLHCTHA